MSETNSSSEARTPVSPASTAGPTPASGSTALSKLAVMLCTVKTMVLEQDPERVLHYVVEQAADAVEGDRCSLFMADPTDGRLYSRIAMGEESPLLVSADKGIVGDVFRHERAVIVRDARADPRFDASVDSTTGYHTESVLAAPIRDSGNGVIGVLEVLNKQDGEFSLLDAEVLEALAAVAGATLDAARQRERLAESLRQGRRRERQLELLYAFEQAFGRQEKLEECIGTALEIVRQALGAEGASVLIGTPDSTGLRFWQIAAGGAGALSGVMLQKGEGIAWQVFSSGQPRLLDAAHDDPSFSWRAEQLSGVVTRDMLAVPLNSEGQTEGVLEVINSQSGGFSGDDLLLAQILAAALAQSLCRLRGLESQRTAERLATVGRMTSSIVHDIKNPLTIIQGYADLLAEEDEPAELARISKVLLHQTDRCRRLTQDLLDFCAGRQNLTLEELQLSTYLSNLEGALKEDLTRARIELLLNVSAGGAFRADPFKLDRVFLNLASNSRAVMSAGGRLTIDCEEQAEDLRFTITDSGPGIPATVAARLFEPFVTHGKREGTGLGLSIVKGIVEAHGGTIALGPGPGAQFLIRLPRSGRKRSA